MKNILLNIFKFCIAGGLIYWLVQSGKLSVETTLELLKNPFTVILCFFLALLNLGLTGIRWNFLLSSRSSIHFKTLTITLVNWIGQFFSSVLPGSVTGDLIKIFYIQKLDEKLSKRFLLFSILSDRIFGLSGLIIMVGLTSLIFHSQLLTLSSDLLHILYFNYLLLFCVISAFAIYFFGDKFVLKVLKKMPHSKICVKVAELWEDMCSIKTRVFYCVLLSLTIQFIGTFIFYLLAKPLLGDVSLFHLLSLVPLGFMSIAIPIAPGGLGVGHAVFEKLFSFIGISHGADFFNLYFLLNISVSLLGVFPYLFFKKKESIS